MSAQPAVRSGKEGVCLLKSTAPFLPDSYFGQEWSDRGFASPLPDEPHLSFNFNLCSTAFITYLFGSVDDIKLPVAPPPHLIERYKTLGKTVYVHPFVNDFTALARYNQNVVYQCHRTVYSSSRTVHGVNTV